MPKKTSLSDFCRALKRHDHFLLSCHRVPEGDAIGSVLALDSLLRRLGKKTTVVCEDPFPRRLSCLSSKRWHQADEVRKRATRFQALVVVDCPLLRRMGEVQGLLSKDTVIFNLDHHVSNIYFGDYNYVRPEAAASAEVVYDLFKYFKRPFTKEEAKNLYVGLNTDTGSFKYGSTTVASHRIAAELIQAGIDVERLNEELNSTYSLNKIQLLSRLLGRVKTAADGRIAWVGMRREDLNHSGATHEDSEGFIDFLKFLKEVKIAFFLWESKKDNEVRVSFRCKGKYDVNKIAASFDGGGHKKAAGCTIAAALEDAEKMVLDRVRKELRA